MKIVKRASGEGSSTYVGYSVEARVIDHKGMDPDPVLLTDGRTLLGGHWLVLGFESGSNPAGVPDGSNPWTINHGYLPYESALALAWTVIAQNPHKQIECRLVRYVVKTAYTIERLGYVGGLEVRSKWFTGIKVIDDADALEPSTPVESARPVEPNEGSQGGQKK